MRQYSIQFWFVLITEIGVWIQDIDFNSISLIKPEIEWSRIAAINQAGFINPICRNSNFSLFHFGNEINFSLIQQTANGLIGITGLD